jgi:O-antigen/teichoic acid export membrane protein
VAAALAARRIAGAASPPAAPGSDPLSEAKSKPESISTREVARGAGLAGLARGSIAIEALAQPWYIWLFGLSTYGIYVVLWGSVNFISNFLDLSMTAALQREVPRQDSEARAHAAVRFALMVSVGLTTIAAFAISFNAYAIAPLFSANPHDTRRLPDAIELFAFALPMWTFVEVATSAARARRAFGPEIRLRVFWEQLLRIVAAGVTFSMGYLTKGLLVAHMVSLGITALLALRLLTRYYDWKLLLFAPIDRKLARTMTLSGFALLPSALSTRALIDAPPVVLNMMLTGTAGASAAGVFEIARKLATVPQIVRQAFQYVLAPLTSAQVRADRSRIGQLYRFASRISTALVLPLSGLMIFASRDIVSIYRKEALPAVPILMLLASGRAAEAIVGPASTIVEMAGHRLLPLLNGVVAVALWLLLALWLVPDHGAWGMAIAVAVAAAVPAYLAVFELRVSDRIWPFDRWMLSGLVIALVGIAAMAPARIYLDDWPRFLTLVALWAATTWLALRYGLPRDDRAGLGKFARKLRLT